MKIIAGLFLGGVLAFAVLAAKLSMAGEIDSFPPKDWIEVPSKNVPEGYLTKSYVPKSETKDNWSKYIQLSIQENNFNTRAGATWVSSTFLIMNAACVEGVDKSLVRSESVFDANGADIGTTLEIACKMRARRYAGLTVPENQISRHFFSLASNGVFILRLYERDPDMSPTMLLEDLSGKEWFEQLAQKAYESVN